MFKLCEGEFINPNTTWYTDKPQLSPCLRDTLLAWLPAGLFILMSFPLELLNLGKAFKRGQGPIPCNFHNVTRLLLTILLSVLKFIECVGHMQYLAVNNSFGTRTSEPGTIVVSAFIKPFIQLFCFAVLAIIYSNHRKAGIHTSGSIWLFLFVSVLCSVPDFYSTISGQRTDVNNNVELYENYAFLPILAVLFMFECRGDAAIVERDPTTLRECSPELSASFLSQTTFWWFTSFLFFGYRTQLRVSSLWKTLPRDQASLLAWRFSQRWISRSKPFTSSVSSPEEAKRYTYLATNGTLQRKNNLALVILKIIWPQLLFAASLKFFQDILQYTTPMILKRLLNFMSTDQPRWHGILFALGFLAVPCVQSLFLANYFFRVQLLGIQIKTMAISAIYRKAMLMSRSSRIGSTTGEIINLMAVDSQRFQDLLMYVNLIWSAPLQITLAVVLLYRELGWSVFAGVATMLIVAPINAFIARRIKFLQLKLMKTKDERIKQMNEILNGIKVIKLYAWENSFMANVLKNRSKELNFLRRISYYDAVQTFLWSCSPFIVALVTFTVYLSSDKSHTLTAEKAFVSISLFNLLRFPLAMLPSLMTSLVLTMVSVTRVNRFLNGDELVRYVTRNDELEAIAIEHGTLSWYAPQCGGDSKSEATAGANADVVQGESSVSKQAEQPTLHDVSLHVKAGSLVAIVGQVASGKSSLLSAILGEMHRISGRFNVTKSARVAYVPQQAWVQNMSVRDNIIFGSEFEATRYEQTLAVCALNADLATFPSGDQSEIGESGLNLSGGQKQRVSLARAVYSNSDIYLLDDPLSALDSHIAKHVFERVLSSTSGLLRNKTRVLATNSLFLLPHVDKIVVFEKGRIVESGTYADLMALKNGRLAETMRERALQESADEQADKEEIALRRKISASGSKPVSAAPTDDTASSSNATDEKDTPGRLIDIERLETGSVNYKVYLSYFKAVSLVWIAAVCMSLVSSASFNVATNLWLSFWSSESETLQKQHQTRIELKTQTSRNTRLITYACLGGMQCLSTLSSSLSLSKAAVRGATRLHSWLLKGVMRSPTTTFFDITPTGRIVNRFAKDIDVVDSTLPSAFKSFLECALGVLSTVFVICYSFPTFLVIIMPLAVVYYLVQRVFIVTSRQLKRLESISRSPIYSNFGETLSGITIIRAFNCEDRFVKHADSLLDTNQSCAYPNIIANRWLSVRLEFTGNLVSCLAGIFSVMSKGSIAPGLVGLAISYSLSITQALSWMVRMSSELETNVVSVERILEYIQNKSEDEWRKDSFQPVQGWPQSGKIVFDKYSTCYRDENALVLRDICLEVLPREKIGIVGRTGSGKTSLSLALFRILEAAGGSISIDGENIASCGLHDLRSRLTIIPQDSVLFSGSLRFNLDPLELYTDAEIWRALEVSHLKPFVWVLAGRLDFRVSEYGENFSHGQRQLVCLARAVLRNSKVIILDEATAAVDVETDELIQKTIRKEFKDSTILTIAHRLDTILDSDRILVLDGGQVRELASPAQLAADKSSVFASMLRAAGIATSKIVGSPNLGHS